MPLVI